MSESLAQTTQKDALKLYAHKHSLSFSFVPFFFCDFLSLSLSFARFGALSLICRGWIPGNELGWTFLYFKPSIPTYHEPKHETIRSCIKWIVLFNLHAILFCICINKRIVAGYILRFKPMHLGVWVQVFVVFLWRSGNWCFDYSECGRGTD